MLTIVESPYFARHWPYFTKDVEDKLILLTIYAKSATSNLTTAKLKELRRDYEKIVTSQ